LDDDAQAMMKFLQSSHDYFNDYLMWYDGAMLHIHRIESGEIVACSWYMFTYLCQVAAVGQQHRGGGG
jgi:hypothetical protein